LSDLGPHRYVRLGSTEIAEPPQQQPIPQAELTADGEHGFEAGRKANFLMRLTPSANHSCCVRQKSRTGSRQYRAGPASLEQRLTELRLKFLDPHADRRLRQIQSLGGAEKTPGFNDL
jgi:hypothetical protein